MKFFCLVGDDVKHSKSHIIHREFLFAFGKGGRYDLISVDAEKFDKTVERLKTHYDGFNVTKPYKERIIGRLESMDRGAAVFSVNTVKVAVDGTARGYSTDGAGFLRSIMQCGANPIGKNILILGTGGVAKAIAHTLTAFDCHIYVHGRNPDNTRQFVELFKGKVGYMDLTLKGKYDFIINCTPVGQVPFVNETALSRDYIEGASVVFDTVYSPSETLLMSYARAEGVKTVVGGLDMLIYQAYESQRIWHEKDLTDEKLCATIEKIKKELKKYETIRD